MWKNMVKYSSRTLGTVVNIANILIHLLLSQLS